MNIHIRNQTVVKMLELLRELKEGKVDRRKLERLLDHEDYKVEFERYNTDGLPMTNITKEEFVEYFLNLHKIDIKDIKNERLKIHHTYYKQFLDNLDFYEKETEKLLSIDEGIFKEGLKYTYNGLPSTITFDSLEVIFTISIGNSFGWPHKNFIHFDVLQFFEMCDIDNLNSFKAFIGHEVHHMGFNKYSQSIGINHFTLEEYLYFFLAFEGLAIKYCNNGEGILTKRIYADIESNIGLDSFSWNYLEKDFEETFHQFKSQIESIRKGDIKDIRQLKGILSEYWFNLHIKEQEKEEIPKLKHSRNYYFGNEIWGLIHDVFGKEKMYELLKGPTDFPAVFNEALAVIGRTDLTI